MKETGNVFDVSSTLMEIDDLPESEADSPLDHSPVSAAEGEPHYFTVDAPLRQLDVRRRALAALALAGGSVAIITMISAAAGFGDDQPSAERPSAARVEQSMSERTVPAVPTPAPGRRARAEAAAQARAELARERSQRARARARAAKAKAAARARHRRRASHTAPPPAPAPEPSYTPEPEVAYAPEPEAAYVPVETAPAPAPSSSGGGQEFGIEP